MNTVTHIAGNVITVGNRVIQRCSLCGEKLCDSLNTMTPINKDGSIPEYPTWEVGKQIRVKEGNPTRYTLLNDDKQLPSDSCYDLLENE